MNLILKTTTIYHLLSIVKQVRPGIFLAGLIFAGVMIHSPLAAQQISLSSVKVTPVSDGINGDKLLVELTGNGWSPEVNVSVSLGTEQGGDNLGQRWYSIVRDISGYLFCQDEDGKSEMIAADMLQILMDDYPALPGMAIWSEVCVLEYLQRKDCRNIRVH